MAEIDSNYANENRVFACAVENCSAEGEGLVCGDQEIPFCRSCGYRLWLLLLPGSKAMPATPIGMRFEQLGLKSA